jgi:pescadillo protein
VELAKRLALEWCAWVVRTSALRKVFISVKGIYFQAGVGGENVSCM